MSKKLSKLNWKKYFNFFKNFGLSSDSLHRHSFPTRTVSIVTIHISLHQHKHRYQIRQKRTNSDVTKNCHFDWHCKRARSCISNIDKNALTKDLHVWFQSDLCLPGGALETSLSKIRRFESNPWNKRPKISWNRRVVRAWTFCAFSTLFKQGGKFIKFVESDKKCSKCVN